MAQNQMHLRFSLIIFLCFFFIPTIAISQTTSGSQSKHIDRYALVTRHNIEWNDLNGQIPLGNGEFCFNVDGTGLQTFGGNTMANWAWHTFPLPKGISSDQIPANGTYQKGKITGLDEFPEGTSAIRQWMFDNPHKFNLGRIQLVKANGQKLNQKEITNLSRTLDLWSGILTSNFMVNGQHVSVVTCVHPEKDMVAIKIESPLLESGELLVQIDFPYPNLNRYKPWIGNFNRIEGNNTFLLIDDESKRYVELRREIDSTTYFTSLHWSKGSFLNANSDSISNTLQIVTNGTGTLKFSCEFKSKPIKVEKSNFKNISKAVEKHWAEFWKNGGAIDLSESKDPRWHELERRIVLSQYQTAVQSAGSFPPAEGGLMGIGPWRGQFHMEMIWWHLAHYALWDRLDMAEKALKSYQQFIPQAKALASQLGYNGLKWPKSVGPDGISAPWNGNLVLLWKQPHPIFFAELEYRQNPTQQTLEKWAEVIEGTAEHMADYAVRDEQTGIYHLNPVMPPSEQGLTKDDVFDLAYWTWGLNQAQIWRERMGLPRNPEWDEVRLNLEVLPVKDSVYIHSPEWTDTYTERAWEHPNPVGVLGMLPLQDNVDFETAHRTLLKVWKTWDWKRCWGWDFPWTAMAAARVGEPNIAVDVLLLDAGKKNYYDKRGVCTGGPCPYLPGNGGLLYAVSMMAAGWDGAPDINAPGFPQDGSWVVKWEGLKKAP